jgi:hypothetical protein
MPAVILEKFNSRQETVSVESPSADLEFMVMGTEDEAEVKALVEGTIPALYVGLVFQSYHIEHQGGGIWEASARYGTKEPKKPGESSFSFDTGGGTQHLTQSKETIDRIALPGEDPPDFKGAIGVSNDSVEGTDITIPVYNFTETHYIPIARITQAYKKKLFELTGTVNDADFKGFEAGEVLFMGASGSQRGKDDWEITYRFAVSPNANNLVVGDMNGIAKKGWEYLWVRYADAEDENVLVKQPVAVYIERVYDEGDFSELGIGV